MMLFINIGNRRGERGLERVKGKIKSLYFEIFSWRFLWEKFKGLLDIQIWILKEKVELEIINFGVMNLKMQN